MSRINLKKKKIFGFFFILFTFFFLVTSVFINNNKNVDLVNDESISIDKSEVKIQLLEHNRLSYNTYIPTPSDSEKLKLIFKDNYLKENFQSNGKSNNCIWFKLTDDEHLMNDVMLFIDPKSKENWIYRFLTPEIIYTADLSDEDVEYIIAMNEKYSLLANQITPNKGKLKLEQNEKEKDWISYIFKLEYTDITLSEVYYEVKYEEGNLIGSNGSHVNHRYYNDGYIKVKVYDDQLKVKKIVFFIRGYEIINEEEVPFQNRYQFLKKDLQ